MAVINMFKWFGKTKDKDPVFSYDQAVILTILLDSGLNLGSKEERNEVEALEKAILEKLPEMSGIDGDGYGDDEAEIFIYGPSADKIWQKIKPVVSASNFSHIDVALQYGSPDDPRTRTKKFTA